MIAGAEAFPRDPDAATRARDLLSQMTIEEKVGQLQQFFWPGERAQAGQFAMHDSEARRALESGTVGALLFVSDAVEANRLQRLHLGSSRLKIPLLFGFDVIHGFRTIFPVPIGLAASWDPELVERCQSAAAREARSVGIHWTFAPMVDVSRDVRWGRIVEGAGEDVHLGSVMAAAHVRGLQGREAYAEGALLAGPKHFAGYGAALGGRDYDEVELSEHELRNVYLPPFKAAIDAGAKNVMTAYMPLNGVPATANRWLLTSVLRDEWRFDGFVVSDANAASNLVTHGFSADLPHAAAAALSAGLDLEMSMGKSAFSSLPEAIAAGLADEAALDRAVLRVLQAKIDVGVLDQPFVDETRSVTTLADPRHRVLARRAAARSAVLLRNEGDLLPLDRRPRAIALVGPLAASRRDILGPWVFEQDDEETITIERGIREALPPGATIAYAPGVAMPSRLHVSPFAAFTGTSDAEDWTNFDDAAELERAIALVQRSDVAVVVVGERFDMSGEIASRASLDLPGGQLELLQAAVRTGTPVILLVMSGRPLDLGWAQRNVPAILQIWYPGTCGGGAVADVLFGLASPGGKLPFTWPRSAGQVPLTYTHVRSHDPANQSRRYWDEDGTPLYPFGHGMTYSTFRLDRLVLSDEQVLPGDTLRVSAEIENTGSREADEVVQLYLGQRHGASVRPTRELKAFRRITVPAGQRRHLSFDIDGSARRYWSAARQGWVEDATTFDLWVGTDSMASLHATFEVRSERDAETDGSGSAANPHPDTELQS